MLSCVSGTPEYMLFDESGKGPECVSHLGTIAEMDEKKVTVVDTVETALSLPRDSLESANYPHKFRRDIVGNYVFEDGLTADFDSADMEAKLFQVLLALRPHVKDLDFTRSDCLRTQIKCVEAIRKCLDFTTFNKETGNGVEKVVDKERYKTGKVAKLALFGQGNCHGCSSLMACFLLPFQDLLGIDVKYRGGCHYSPGQAVNNDVEQHQWLELTYRPSMHTTICDLWLAGVHGDSSYLSMDV